MRIDDARTWAFLVPIALAFAAPTVFAQDVGTLGSARITAGEAKLLGSLDPRAAASEEGLEALVRQTLLQRALAGEAAAGNWDKRPEVAERARLAREGAIASTWLESVSAVPPDYPAETEVKALYEQNRAKLQMPRRYHLAQIFVRRPANSDEVPAAEKHAADLARRAASGEDFAALARSESQEATGRENGGDLGWNAEPALLPEIRTAVQALKTGGTSAPVASGGGWHIVRLIETREAAAATYEEARPSLVRTLRQRRAAELRQAHIDGLLKQTPPQVDRTRLSEVSKELRPGK